MSAEPPAPALWRGLSRLLAGLPPFARGRDLWEANQKDWNLPLSKWDKLIAGGHLILSDYAAGNFPPTFDDQRAAYEAEMAYRQTIPQAQEETAAIELRKPFWFGKAGRRYLESLIRLAAGFERLGVHPPQRLLELGCGSGWMAEALAQMGFEILGTSIGPDEIADAHRRLAGLQAKGVAVNLEFEISPMETVHERVERRPPFDAAYVYEALHHAYDWRATFESVGRCLRSGGWLVVAQEPNLIHTAASYRVARLSNTHEIGLSRTRMVEHLNRCGFANITVLRNRMHGWVRAHWFAAQKT